jgi:GNAT superfamily N-acetyltransferase
LAPDDLELSIKKIEPGDRLSGLSLGDASFTPLKIFLKKHARKYEENNLARTYAAFSAAKLYGYITLVCGEVTTDAGGPALAQAPGVDYPYSHFPAIKIARLAVDTSARGSGLGRSLVDLSLGIAKDVICPAVGCRFVMVDSKKSAVPFYERCGFTILDSAENRGRAEPVMFVDLNRIA